MRKIEKAMCAAIKKERRNWKSGNTEVECVNVGDRITGYYKRVWVYLHGNLIYKWNEAEDIAEFTLAGWNTNTTRSRLNALGVGVTQRNFAPYYDGKEIDEYKWYMVK